MAPAIIGKGEPAGPDSLPKGHPAEALVVTHTSLLPFAMAAAGPLQTAEPL